MDQITAVIQGAETKVFDRKDGSGQFTKFMVNLNGEKYQTTENHFHFAQANVGAQIIASIKVEQNGQYTNKYLTNVQPLTPHNSGMQMPQAVVAQQPAFIPQPEMHPDAKTMMIHRQCAAKVAAHTSSTPEDFWSNVDDLVHYFNTGVKPGSVAAGAMQAQAARLSEQVAVSLNPPQPAFTGGYVGAPGVVSNPGYLGQPMNGMNTQDDDIPF